MEALIVLPVLGILLASLPWSFERLAGRQRGLLEARRCAWAPALTGCDGVPASCRAVALRAGRSMAGARETDLVARTRRDLGSAGAEVFDAVPALGSALSAVLGETAHARAVVELRARAGTRERLETDLAIACNERPRDLQQVARDVFCTRLPILDCGD